jgi:hypothetical protein
LVFVKGWNVVAPAFNLIRGDAAIVIAGKVIERGVIVEVVGSEVGSKVAGRGAIVNC